MMIMIVRTVVRTVVLALMVYNLFLYIYIFNLIYFHIPRLPPPPPPPLSPWLFNMCTYSRIVSTVPQLSRVR